ncbi:hypothetical protein PHAVU_008G060400 [Phaseolus vulgaris]|uniref:Uncharacterized protein n=1 Tax=Phaseolus vulgaris TaxID=3885 RepID=V7B2L1_PHAVU|nr:hypothetical protein PHAVU_008G060400g [Phaseolus vulgaris]ESW11800.1 hypothetical protein PHAVU_008G060400g [Phaseolus vulgaris]
MSITTGIYHVVAVSLLLGSLNVYFLECEDDRCKTGLCNSSGACICNLPDPSTILNGNRTFLGTMCYCQVQKTLAVLAFSVVGATVVGAIYGKKLFSKKKREAVKFQQLSEMHTKGILDDDDISHI